MIRKIAIMLFLYVVSVCPAAAQPKGIGLGLILGDPTGLSFKTWLDKKIAIDAAAAWSLSDDDSFQFHADYLIHPSPLTAPAELKGRLLFYYGLGGRLKLRESNGRRNDHEDLLGIRVPFGLSYTPAATQVELFGEIVPILDIAPDTDADMNAAIGARYYF